MLDVATVHRRARRVLPAQVHTRGVVLYACDAPTLCALLMPLAHRRSGRIVFRLEDDTLHALASRPMALLHAATQAREGLHPRVAPFEYAPWCAMQHDGAACFLTARRDGRATLALWPAQQQAVYAWNDRGVVPATPHAWR